jgi:hypothetical protein
MTGVGLSSWSSPHEIVRRIMAQVHFRIGRRRQAARAALFNVLPRRRLRRRRHARPAARQAIGIAGAGAVPPAAAARARAPQRQRLAIKRLDRRERGFAPDALFVEGEALGMKASRPRSLVSRRHFILRQIRLAPWEW